jgi:hypothetical protein
MRFDSCRIGLLRARTNLLQPETANRIDLKALKRESMNTAARCTVRLMWY